MKKYLVGDIFVVKGRGIVPWLSSVFFTPRTSITHLGLMGPYISYEDDYLVIESIASKGVIINRFSAHKSEEIEIYRIDNPDADYIGGLAFYEATKLGRFPYDYFLPVKLLAGAIRLLFAKKFPPWNLKDFPYAKNNKFLCTELVDTAYTAAGYTIISHDMVPLPTAFQEVINNGMLVRVE